MPIAYLRSLCYGIFEVKPILLLRWQGKRHDTAAGWGVVLAATAHNDHIFPAGNAVHRGGRVARRRQNRLPQQPPGQLIVSAEFLVEICGADEQQSALRD